MYLMMRNQGHCILKLRLLKCARVEVSGGLIQQGSAGLHTPAKI